MLLFLLSRQEIIELSSLNVREQMLLKPPQTGKTTTNYDRIKNILVQIDKRLDLEKNESTKLLEISGMKRERKIVFVQFRISCDVN